MREIKLLIQREEDIVMLMQGINWIRQHNIQRTREYFDLMDKMPKKLQKNYSKVLGDHSKNHDCLMCLLAQLDDLLEKKK